MQDLDYVSEFDLRLSLYLTGGTGKS
jgi:hypothetical protein